MYTGGFDGVNYPGQDELGYVWHILANYSTSKGCSEALIACVSTQWTLEPEQCAPIFNDDVLVHSTGHPRCVARYGTEHLSGKSLR